MKYTFPHFLAATLTAGAAIAGLLSADAKPASPSVLNMTCADGSEIQAKLVGDEYGHCYLTPDGYPLQEINGQFQYISLSPDGSAIPSGVVASDFRNRSATEKAFVEILRKEDIAAALELHAAQNPRLLRKAVSQIPTSPSKVRRLNGSAPYEMGPGLFTDIRFPAYGNQKAIVILVEYQDVRFSSAYPKGGGAKSYFTRMLNEEGFDDYGATGSAAEYFRINSGDCFQPEFDVYGPVTLSHRQSYYGANDAYGNDKHPEEMVIEACSMLDDSVDFRDYDRNNDGVIDNVFVFYAGRGEATGGGSNSVWPHSWTLPEAGVPDTYFDGVRLHTYGCSNEWEGSRADGVGTFVHEFSHVLGLPDLYATSYSTAFTPGFWSVLDYGPYNNDGMTPPLYGAFERYALGWTAPQEIGKAEDVTLRPVETNHCAVIRTGNHNEFFLLENRQQTGWDTYIPGHGMLVWHIDYDEAIWTDNSVNNNPAHQYVDILEADDRLTSSTRDGDAFPGTRSVTSLTPDTDPSLTTWAGETLDVPLTEIRETPSGDVTFKVKGGSSLSVIGSIDGAGPDWRLEGNDIVSESNELTVTTVSGAIVASGADRIPLPTHGIYIVKDASTGKSFKIIR